MNFFKRWIAPVVVLSGIIAAGANEAPATQPIDDAIAHLGDSDPAVREQAVKVLRDAGLAARPALEAAAKGDDPEIAARARGILKSVPKVVAPDAPNPADSLPGVITYRMADPQVKPQLIEQLKNDQNSGVRALTRLWLAEKNQDLRGQIFDALIEHPSPAAGALLADGNVASAELLLDAAVDRKSADSIQAYAAYALMRGRVDDAIRRWRSRGGKTPADTWAEEVLAGLYRAKGDAAQAIVHARASEDTDLIEATLMWAGDWKQLAEELQRDDRAMEDPHQLALRTGVEKLADDGKGVDDDLIRLSAIGKRTGKTSIAADTMLVTDRAPDAVKYLIDGGQLADAYEILSDQRKLNEAAALVLDHDMETTEEAMALRATAAAAMARHGHNAGANQLIERVAKENAASRSPRVLMLMGEAARAAGATDKSWDFFESAIESSRGAPAQYSNIFKTFPPKDTDVEWPLLWFAASRSDPQRSVRKLFDRIRTAYDGSMPLDDLTSAVRSVNLADPGNKPYIELTWEAARRERAAGDEHAAEQLMQQQAMRESSGDLEMHLGDWSVEKKDWSAAAAHYEAAWNKDRARALPLYLMGWALEQGGQAAEGRERIALAHLLPVGDEARRFDLVRGLFIRGMNEAAAREADMTIRVGHPMSFYSESAFRMVAERAEENGDFSFSGALWQRVMVDSLANSNLFQTHAMFLHLPNIERRLQARAKLATGDIDGAKKIIDAAMQFLSIDGELVLQLVNDLDKAGRRADADELFKKGFAIADGLCQKYPESGYDLNEASWLAAKCHRELDKALDYATRAVRLDPKNPAEIDTLAEVYFQRGEPAKAVEFEKQCVELSPINPIHRHQLERFIAANEKSPIGQ